MSSPSPLLVALMARVTDHCWAEKPTVVVVTEAQLRYLNQVDRRIAEMRTWTSEYLDTAKALAFALDVERVEVWGEHQMLDLRAVTERPVPRET